jgi:LysR family glycine cleavage system transcriptional activator
MPRPLPPLAAIRCFEAASRHLSFTRAAEELAMTQAAVSYQIRLLEERVGLPLFERGPRGVALSDAGRRLAPLVAEAFATLRAAFETLAGEDDVLVVSAIDTFASNWLVPRLGNFQLAHPGIAVRLDVSGHLVDFSREPVDVGIRGGRGVWPGLVAHRLIDVEFTPMMSPELLAAVGPIRAPADLLKLQLIDPGDVWWIEWFAAAGIHAPEIADRPGIRVDTQRLTARIALAGHGVALLTPAFFPEEIAAGRLVQPLPSVHRTGTSYWLVYPKARRNTAKIRAFRDWVLAEVQGGG